MTLAGAGASGPHLCVQRLVIPGRHSEAEASPESILPDRWLWIAGSRPAAEPRNDCTDGVTPPKKRSSDPGSPRARKPDGIDFVGNSKISSFCPNPPPTALYCTYS